MEEGKGLARRMNPPLGGGMANPSDKETTMNDELSDEYGAAIGSVMDARKQYETVCTAQGSDSWAAHQAHEYLLREVQHRDEMRARHDASPGDRTAR